MLSDNLDKLIMESMKNHTEVRTRTLRAIKAAFIEARTAKGASELDETKEIQVMQKMVKQREDARSQYIKANRIELAKNEFEEIEVIKEFLPKPVSREEIVEYVDSLDKSLQIGGIIKITKVKYPSADGKLIAEIVKNSLK